MVFDHLPWFTLTSTRVLVVQQDVIMIVLDTLRSDRLGTYGYDLNTSPNIDALGESGLVFDRSYAASPWTWPSTASLFTALSPPEHGIVGAKSSFLVDEMETIAESFLQHGLPTFTSPFCFWLPNLL